MHARMIRQEEWLRTEELFALAFEQPMKRSEKTEPDELLHWSAFDDDGEMMSTLTITEFPVRFDGERCRMGGVGGVGTLPQYRHRGGIRACFRECLPELYRREFDFAYLYPFSNRFYRKFGFENCVRRQFTAVNLKLWPQETVPGSFRLAEPGKDLRQDIRAIDRVWEDRFNLAVLHDEKFYDWVTEQDPAAKQEFCFVWYDAEGAPGAYAVYRRVDEDGQRNLNCSHFRFLSRQGFRALLWLFRNQSSSHLYVRFPLPDSPGMGYLMDEWSMGAVIRHIHGGGMVRVIRVTEVLKKARYLGSGSAVLEIHDPMIPENSGRFRVTFADGRAVTVERASESPDVKLEINAFSALICGACSLEDAAMLMDGVQVLHKDAPLGSIFYQKPSFIADYF